MAPTSLENLESLGKSWKKYMIPESHGMSWKLVGLSWKNRISRIT